MFLMLSDIHFDPYSDPVIMEQLGAKPTAACRVPTPTAFSKFGSDSNYPLLKSTLDHVVATAAANHIHYDYVIATGDFLAHKFDARFEQCVGGGADAHGKFAANTLRFVDGMIAKALPGVPVFAALGNNDSDRGDYAAPSPAFLKGAAGSRSLGWRNLPAELRAAATASFEKAGYYSLPNPAVANHELIVINSNLWAAHNSQACSDSDPDPGGQFRWLAGVLERIDRAHGRASLIMHILPGIDAIKSSAGAPREFWTQACTQKLISELSSFPGVVRGMYAGHIHRDDFRLLPGADGQPLCAIHIIPAVSPVYLDNPAVEIGWYDKANGDLKDFATLVLNLGGTKPAWETEYVFTRAYGRGSPDLATLAELSKAIRVGNPSSGVGKQYASFYGAGVSIFLTPSNWLSYACAQTEITSSSYDRCRSAGATP